MDEQKPPPKDDRYSALIRGKSDLQLRLEKELEEKRAAHEALYGKRERKPIKWYWRLAIVAGLALWTALSFYYTSDW